jgi:hypothetical protein
MNVPEEITEIGGMEMSNKLKESGRNQKKLEKIRGT